MHNTGSNVLHVYNNLQKITHHERATVLFGIPKQDRKEQSYG